MIPEIAQSQMLSDILLGLCFGGTFGVLCLAAHFFKKWWQVLLILEVWHLIICFCLLEANDYKIGGKTFASGGDTVNSWILDVWVDSCTVKYGEVPAWVPEIFCGQPAAGIYNFTNYMPIYKYHIFYQSLYPGESKPIVFGKSIWSSFVLCWYSHRAMLGCLSYMLGTIIIDIGMVFF